MTSRTPDSGTSPARIIEMTLPGILGFEKVARNAAAAVAEQMGFSADRVEDLKTAVAEACMNAIEHGNASEAGSHILVALRFDPAQLEVRVRDQGMGSLPDPLPPPGYPDRSRGWGLFFIHNLMDEVEVERLPEGGNQVCMTIHLQPIAGEAQASTAAESGPAEGENSADAVSLPVDRLSESVPPEGETAQPDAPPSVEDAG